MSKILIIILSLFSFSASAFYSSFEDDMAKLREGVNKQAGTQAQKDAFIKQLEPSIKQARKEAYIRLANGCASDINRLCKKSQKTLDKSIKCLSDNKRMLSSSCKYIIMQNFRQN